MVKWLFVHSQESYLLYTVFVRCYVKCMKSANCGHMYGFNSDL